MKIIARAALAAFPLVSACLCVSCDTTGYERPRIDEKKIERAEEYIKKGSYYFKERAYRQALSEFRKAAKISPEFFNARYNIAKTHIQRGNIDKAIEELKKLNSDFKGNIAAFNALGQVFSERGKEKEALKMFSTAIGNGEALLKNAKVPQARVDIAMAYHNLASMQMKAGNLDEAEENLRKSIEMHDSNFYSHYALGALLVRTGKYEEAREELKKARELNARFVQADIEIARAYLLSKPPHVMFAISALRDALRKDPDNPEIFELLGNCYILRGKPDEKAKESDYTEAIKYYREVLNLNKKDAKSLILLARACALAGENDAARELLQKLPEKKTDIPPKIRMQVHLVRGHILKSEGKWAQAGEEFKKAAEAGPDDGAALLEAGLCFYKAKNYDEARTRLETALGKLGDDAPGYLKAKIDAAKEMLLALR